MNFSLSRKASNIPDYSLLGTDIHSHLLPGMDDGSQTTEESLALIRGMLDLGFRKLITTPHANRRYPANTPENITTALNRLRLAASDQGIQVSIEASAEYLVDDDFLDKIRSKQLLPFGNNYLLIELSFYNPHPTWRTCIFELQHAGYQIILAHAERYSFWFSDFKKFEELKGFGVLFQVNTVSFAGHYNTAVRKTAEKLADSGMVDFLGSDLHNRRYLKGLRQALKLKHLEKLMDSGKLQNSGL